MPTADGKSEWRRRSPSGQIARSTALRLCKIPGFFLHLGEPGAMDEPTLEVFEFSGFTLVPGERLLLDGFAAVLLSPRAFDLLLALVRRAGRLAIKDELLAEVWSGLTVEEVNLSVNISLLRKALRPGSGEAVIQTVPKAGYRLVAPVSRRLVAASLLLPRSRPARRLDQQPGADRDAQRAYVEGRYHWSRRSEEGLKRAVDCFRRAVAEDPTFAAAYSGLADCYATLGYLSHLAPADSFPAARGYAEMALERDSSLAEPYTSLGYVKFYFDWDWAGADAAFRQALARDPEWAPAHQWYSILLLAAGRAAEARREITIACEREPLSLQINTDLGFHYYYTGQYTEAVKQLRSVLAMQADFVPAHLWLGRSYQELGDYDTALAAFRAVEAVTPEWPVAIAARGFVEGLAGRTACATATLAQLRELSQRRFVTPYGIALVEAGLGCRDAALTSLETAFVERSHWLVWLRLDRRWRDLRSEPRFTQLVEWMHFPD
jgi:DNA-binding winged helix-turn-helix (wHTH) protein